MTIVPCHLTAARSDLQVTSRAARSGTADYARIEREHGAPPLGK